MLIANTGRKLTPEQIARREATKRARGNTRAGTTQPSEMRERISRTNREKGIRQSPKAIAKAAELNRGKPRSPEQDAKRLASWQASREAGLHNMPDRTRSVIILMVLQTMGSIVLQTFL